MIEVSTFEEGYENAFYGQHSVLRIDGIRIAFKPTLNGVKILFPGYRIKPSFDEVTKVLQHHSGIGIKDDWKLEEFDHDVGILDRGRFVFFGSRCATEQENEKLSKDIQPICTTV